MFSGYDISTVAHVIQIAVAPVFLLSGIGAMLAVMTNRLARIVDRTRALQTAPTSHDAKAVSSSQLELAALYKRAKVVSIAVTLCTITALLISAVIAVLFLGTFLNFNAAMPVALLFIAAMLTFICSLLFFLREIFLATASVKMGAYRLRENSTVK